MVIDHRNGRYAIALDPCFIDKAGNKTPGIGYFWSGQAGQAKRGIEIVGTAAIDIVNHTGFHLEAVQILVNEDDNITPIDLYAETIISRKQTLHSLSTVIIANVWYSQKPFVDNMLDNGFDLVNRLRSDARLKYLYQGKPTGERGRPQKYAGRVNPKMLDLDAFETTVIPMAQNMQE